jgi:predicted acetyltransferase
MVRLAQVLLSQVDQAGAIELPREQSAFAEPLDRRGVVRYVSPEEAPEVLAPILDRVRVQTPGMFARTRDWWESRTAADPPEWRPPGAGPKRFVVFELDGEIEGYSIYRHVPKWEAGVSSGKLNVIETLATTTQATRELWRYLCDIEWVETVSATLLPIDHPLFFVLANPRRMSFRVGDGVWMRLVDVRACLSARSYAEDGAVVFEVADAFCPWNEGRWRLEGGEAARTDEAPDLGVDVAALGAVYLGGFTFAQLVRAGRVEELTERAAARADRLFRTDRAPWCQEIF